MFRRIWLVNGVLIVLLGIIGIGNYRVWTQRDSPALMTPPTGAPPVSETDTSSRKISMPESVFESLVKKDLFSPERKEFMQDKPAPRPSGIQRESLEKALALYGTVLLEEYKAALIRELKKKSDGPTERWVRMGDTVGDVRIVDIKKERIVIARGEERCEVYLYDKNKPQKPVTAKSGESKPLVVNAPYQSRESAPGNQRGTRDERSAFGKSDDKKWNKYKGVKKPSEEMRKRIVSKYSQMPPPQQTTQVNETRDWDIPEKVEKGVPEEKRTPMGIQTKQPQSSIRDWDR